MYGDTIYYKGLGVDGLKDYVGKWADGEIGAVIH